MRSAETLSQTEPLGMTPRVFRELCAELSLLQYRGVPLGETLNDRLVIDFFWGHGDWRLWTRWLTQARRIRHWLCPRRGDRAAEALARNRVLMTWYTSTPRIDEMLLPVVDEIGADRSLVLVGDSGDASALRAGAPTFDWEHAMGLRSKEWRAEYRRRRPEWARTLKDVCLRYRLPAGAFGRLSLDLMVASQRIEGFREFLERSGPAAVLTEYDRNHLWSCLVLAARLARIPTVTLVHGVMGPEAIGFTPVLAGRIVCWGEADKRKLLAAGEPLQRIVVGGCPRLTRDLAITKSEARARVGFDPETRLVLLATSPDRGRLELAELFCATVDTMPDFLGVIRLHPAESMPVYAKVAKRHPRIRFMENPDATLDESLAAADVVVTRGSGVGGDALLKRRPVVVLDPEGELAGNDWDLVRRAGCPHVRSSKELGDTLRRLLSDDAFREARAEAAERYVADFCRAFGKESARLIGNIVRETATGSGS